MNELLDQEYENALISAKKLGGILEGKTDIGPEAVKLCMFSMYTYQRTLGSITQDRAVTLKIINHITGKEREEHKKLVKEQKLLESKK